jgi:hypothetical protein
MSHGTGSFIDLAGTPFNIGPDFGAGNNVAFPHTPPPAGAGPTKLLILHFQNVNLPGASRLEVDLGYPTGERDVFRAADGSDFWTRPINVAAFADALVPISYIPSGAGGGAQITGYGRGERHEEAVPGGKHDSFSNSDPFLVSGAYTEPDYDPFWLCHQPPHWDNVEGLPNDVRRTVAQSVGMLVNVHGSHVSTCSSTLIGSDLVISAAHCIDAPGDIASMSVIFNYQTNADGSKPAGYAPVFHKVIELISHGPLGGSSDIDYMVVRIRTPAGGLGISPIPMRATRPAVGEEVFDVHHPNGAVKKISPRIADPFAVVLANPGIGRLPTQLDVTGGTSGSGLFDTMGRFVGVLSAGQGGPFASRPIDRNPECLVEYAASHQILDHLQNGLPASPARDVMIVFDRSGSMSETTPTTLTKLQEAKHAAALFVELARVDGGDQIGLVTFSSAPAAPFPLADISNGNKATLIGASAPFTGGLIGGITAGGNTNIGGGLAMARDQMNLHGIGGNRRTIFLLTDGLHNTGTPVQTASDSLFDTDVFAVGYGSEAALDGTLLTKLAHDHGGLYLRAGDGLALLKFFALTFGNIFEAGTLLDPEFLLPAGSDLAKPLPFQICEESTVTIVLGWERASTPLFFRVQMPSGAFLDFPAHGVDSAAGPTWRFARIALPHAGERNGLWQVHVLRAGGGGEFPPPSVDVRYFVNVLAKDGPRVTLQSRRRHYYTGDAYLPLVAVATHAGFRAPNARVTMTVDQPNDGTGNLLSRAGLGDAIAELDGDGVPARVAALKQLEASRGGRLFDYRQDSYELLDEGGQDDGAMEPDGIFGLKLPDLFRHEGHYAFRAVASYGAGCVGSREISWSVHVEPGIDASRTEIRIQVLGTLPDGGTKVRVTVTPMDQYGNLLGPGRLDKFDLAAAPGSTILSGAVKDNGDGSYQVIVRHDPASGTQPGLVLQQPDRPAIVLLPPAPAAPPVAPPGKASSCLLWVLLAIILILVILLIVT